MRCDDNHSGNDSNDDNCDASGLGNDRGMVVVLILMAVMITMTMVIMEMILFMIIEIMM